MTVPRKALRSDQIGPKLGLQLGGLSSLLYLILIMLLSIVWDTLLYTSHAPLSAAISDASLIGVFGCVLGVLPAIALSTLASWLTGLMVDRLRHRLSHRMALFLGISTATVLALPINLLFTSIIRPQDFLIYLLIVGIPSIAFIIGEGYIAIRIYHQNAG